MWKSAANGVGIMAERKLSPLLILPPLIFAALAVMFYVGLNREDPNAMPSTRVGHPAPPVTLSQLGTLPLFNDASLRSGGVKLVNFWASWCVPCRVEHPMLVKLASQGITIYGVNYKDKPGNALGFLTEGGNPFRATGADAKGGMAINWGVFGVPETFVIDATGKVMLRFAGPITERSLKSKIMPAIRKAAGKP